MNMEHFARSRAPFKWGDMRTGKDEGDRMSEQNCPGPKGFIAVDPYNKGSIVESCSVVIAALFCLGNVVPDAPV